MHYPRYQHLSLASVPRRERLGYRKALASRPVVCVVLSAVLATAGVGQAQDPVAPAAPMDAAAPADAAKAPPPTELPTLTTISDPLIRAMLANNPTTPREVMGTIKVIVDRRQPAIARPLVERLLQAKLEPETAAALRETYGTATFLRLARVPELAPAGQQLATAVLTAADTWTRDPARLTAAVEQLSDSSPSSRRAAFRILQQGGTASVAPLVTALADTGRADEHAVVRDALVALGRDSTPPLVAALETPDPALKAQLIAVLARLEAREAMSFVFAPALADDSDPALKNAARQALIALLGRVPSARDAASVLADEAQQRYDESRTLPIRAADKVEVWRWDAEQGQTIPQMLPPRLASAITAARLASDAYRLAPGDLHIQRIYLGTLLEAAVLQAGLDERLPESLGAAAKTGLSLGASALEDVLQNSLESGHVPAATAAAALLGRSGLSELVQSDSAELRPLVVAARHADRRLRFAAVNAILTINPQQPFAGSSFITDALRFFVATTGTRRALVATPRQDEAHRLGALLIESGYQHDVAIDDRSLFQQAQAVPDYELLLVDVRLPGRPIEELLQQLLRDNQTGTLPVGLIASPDDLPRAHEAIKHHPGAMVFVRPVDPAGIATQVQALIDHSEPLVLTPAERAEQARRSLEWLARLASEPRAIYNLQHADVSAEAALYVPELTANAMEVLSSLPSAKGQRAIVELASRTTQPLETRQQAAEAFDRSVGRHGVLLTSAEILRQYDRYNRSATLDEATQQVLGQLLDTLESRVVAGPSVPTPNPPPQELPAAASR